MSGTVIKILILITLVVVIINDIGVVATGYYAADDKAHKVANAALADYRINTDINSAAAAAQEMARDQSVVLTGFQITEKLVRVSIKVPAKKTWIANRIDALKPYISATDLVELPLR